MSPSPRPSARRIPELAPVRNLESETATAASGAARPMRLTAQAHARLAPSLEPGDWALDATAGNGHDTLFLASQVAPSGQVWAWDTQPAALAATRMRLQAAGLEATATLVQASHHRLRERMPTRAHGRLRAVMFDLGYRPGGDPQHITQPGTTIPALKAACQLLHPDGMISLLA